MIGVAITLLLLLAIAAYVLSRARPATEAVRLRNALLLQASQPSDFTWQPPYFPAGFVVERSPVPVEVRQIVDTLGAGAIERDWDRALTLAGHLTECAQDKGPIQADILTTYRAIRLGYGYCADFVKVFLALAHASGLIVRQWGFSFDGFGGHGHAVVELFDRQRSRWLMLDVYNNLHLADASTGEPLGVLECINALGGHGAAPELRLNGRGRPGFVHADKAFEYYRRGIHQWYMVWGNAVFSYYANPLVKAAGRISRMLAHVTANALGVQPRIHIYQCRENAEQVRKIFSLRRRLIGSACVSAFLLAALAVQLTLIAGTARFDR